MSICVATFAPWHRQSFQFLALTLVVSSPDNHVAQEPLKTLGPCLQICVCMERNGEKVLGFSWNGLTQEIDMALNNVASQQKVAIVPSRIQSIFRVVHPHRFSTYPALFVDALAFVLSTSTSRAILLQPVPSKLFTTVVLLVTHSKNNLLHHRRLTRLHSTRHFHRA